MPWLFGGSPPASFSHHPGGRPHTLELFTPGFQEATWPGALTQPQEKPASLSAANWKEEGLLLLCSFSLSCLCFTVKKRIQWFLSQGHRAFEGKQERGEKSKSPDLQPWDPAKTFSPAGTHFHACNSGSPWCLPSTWDPGRIALNLYSTARGHPESPQGVC